MAEAASAPQAAQWSSQVLCRYYLSGCCLRGENCNYSHDRQNAKPSTVCRFYSAGKCSYGDRCRYDHVRPKVNSHQLNPPNPPPPPQPPIAKVVHKAPVTKESAPASSQVQEEAIPVNKEVPLTYRDALRGASEEPEKGASSEPPLCPYYWKEGACPFDDACEYVHGQLCDICQLHCLHPTDATQRATHQSECLSELERDMEESFRVQRSREKVCGICMETVWEKEQSVEQRFGILSHCSHCFCLECIRKWRSSKQYQNPVIRGCPECRVKSDFVTPSRYWPEADEEKTRMIQDYKESLSKKSCKYFAKDGHCPFGNKCFYRHTNKDGQVVNLPSPKSMRRGRRRHFSGESDDLSSFAFSLMDLLQFDSDSDSDDDLSDHYVWNLPLGFHPLADESGDLPDWFWLTYEPDEDLFY